MSGIYEGTLKYKYSERIIGDMSDEPDYMQNVIHPDSPMNLSAFKKCPSCTHWILSKTHGEPYCENIYFKSCLANNRMYWRNRNFEFNEFIKKEEMDII